MKSFDLDEYLSDSYYLQYPIDIEVTSIFFNSKLVKKNSIFVAIKGFKVDGNNYIEDAIKNGASLIVSDMLPTKNYDNVGFLIVKNARIALAKLSQKIYNFPDKKLKIIGITGTDGKTSTSFYTYSLLKELNYKVGLICTTNIDIKNTIEPSPFRQSTPDANILFQLLDQCVKNNKEYVVLEATSHALSLFFSRLADIELEASIITTITHEHIDFHKTEEEYINAKLSIIDRLKENGFLITTKNNKQFDKCINKTKEANKKYYVVEDLIKYEILNNNTLDKKIIKFEDKTYPTNINLEVFISNALLAVLCINKLTSISFDKILNKLIKVNQINGRFNFIQNNIDRTIIVDFAHTSDAFNNLFSQIKKTNKRIIALFGCGGERDLEKRYEMGKIAGLFCDIIVLSEEDPRFEDNNKIMADIEKGIINSNKEIELYKINNRYKAIEKVFEISKKNDILLFLGKGHETSIEREGIKYPYNEIQLINEVIKKLYE